MSNETVTVTNTCFYYGKNSDIDVLLRDYNLWVGGAFVQDAFPYLDDDKREQLVSGLHGKCFDDAFPDD